MSQSGSGDHLSTSSRNPCPSRLIYKRHAMSRKAQGSMAASNMPQQRSVFVPRRHDESASELAESKKKSLLRVADSPRIGPRHDQCKSCEQTAAHACTVGCSESARLASQRGCIRPDLTSRLFLPCEAGGGHHINPSTIRRRKLCLDKKTPQYGSAPAGLGGGAGRGEQALSFTRKSRRVLESDTEGRHCPPSVFRVDGPSQLEPQAAASCWWWW